MMFYQLGKDCVLFYKINEMNLHLILFFHFMTLFCIVHYVVIVISKPARVKLRYNIF